MAPRTNPQRRVPLFIVIAFFAVSACSEILAFGHPTVAGRLVGTDEVVELEIWPLGGLERRVVLSIGEAESVFVLCSDGYYPEVVEDTQEDPNNNECNDRAGAKRPILRGVDNRVEVEWEHYHGVSVCPNSATGLDNFVLHVGGGGTKVSTYDLVFSFVSESEWRLEYVLARASVDPSANATACEWRQWQSAEREIAEAMETFTVGAFHSSRGSVLTESSRLRINLPVREVPSDLARQHLMALLGDFARHLLTFEGAHYSTGEVSAAWNVIQIQTRRGYCDDLKGVVVVHDRHNDRWWQIYDLEIDCRENHSLENMWVHGNRLFAWMCRTCEWDTRPERSDLVVFELGQLGRHGVGSIPVFRVIQVNDMQVLKEMGGVGAVSRPNIVLDSTAIREKIRALGAK